MILDEPTTGLDPQARHLLWKKLRQLKRQQRTLVLSTHYMDEAEQLCDRLVFMENGRIVAQGAPGDLIRDHVSREVVEIFGDLDLVKNPATKSRHPNITMELLQDLVAVVRG